MNLKINGKDYSFDEQDITIYSALSKLNITKKVIIELNGEIVSQSEFESIKLKEDDILEILYFMGGG